MPSPFLWLSILGPLSLVMLGSIPKAVAARRTRAVVTAARYAAMSALMIAVGTGVAVAVLGAIRTPELSVQGIGFSLYLDALSATMLVLVAFIGLIVIVYSGNYLDGDPHQGRFLSRLCVTLACVLGLIISGNLFQLALLWIATSLGLNGLLKFYPDRPAAVLAARKKFLVSRLGDLCLIAAMVLLYLSFGSLDYGTLFAACGALRQAAPAAVHAAVALMVLAAALKSAQFPMYGWLIEVMETPTPVSALLHAGIINAGGFLLLRFADLLVLSAPSLDGLALIGGFTALFGSAVMLTQSSIKVSLAYSTVAQMGFMMLECGLGAFPAALLHIVAHSFYKAHAFLSSGSVIDIAGNAWSPPPGSNPHPARLVLVIALVLGMTLGVSVMAGASPAEKPGVFALAAVMMFSLIHLIASGIDEQPSVYVVMRTAARAVVVAIVFFGLQLGFERLLISASPAAMPLQGPIQFAIACLVIVSFGALTVFQSLLPYRQDKASWQSLYVHIYNGLYVNTLANRWIIRLWPSPPPRRTHALHANVHLRGVQA